MRLGDLEIGTRFKCPWREGKQPINTLVDKTISAAWVEFMEPREIKREDKITKAITIIKQTFKTRESWSLGTEVTVI